MLEQLFGSKTRVKMLKVFFYSPKTSFFVRELSRQLDTQINAVRRELKILLATNLILEVDKDPEDRKKAGATLRKYYKLNTGSMLYPEMHSLLMKAQVLGEQQFIEKIKVKGGSIDLLLLTGRFVADSEAPSDLLIVGDIKVRNLVKLIAGYEKEMGTEIRYTLMTTSEFTERQQMMDRFLFSLFEGKNFKVIDNITE
mgnify:FL=1